jgi:LysR family transcriptional regulator, glycine cleavage system transcriptional activator
MTLDWRTLPSLSALRAFDATARHGGFTGAGRALNVTHAAVAQQVRGLERELGLPLVQRLGRAVSLTPQGEGLARTLGEGFEAIARAIAAAQRQDRQRGLRVATTPYSGQKVILPRLSEFFTLHPDIEVAITPGYATVDLIREGYDLAIRGVRPEGPDAHLYETIHLAKSRWLIVGAPALLGDGPVDVKALPWIFLTENRLDRDILEQAGIATDALKKVMVGGAVLEVAAAVLGLGLNLATEISVRDDLAAGRLREVPVPNLPETHYYAILPVGPRRPAVQHFLDWVKTLF